MDRIKTMTLGTRLKDCPVVVYILSILCILFDLNRHQGQVHHRRVQPCAGLPIGLRPAHRRYFAPTVHARAAPSPCRRTSHR